MNFSTVYHDRAITLKVSKNPPAWAIDVRPAANVVPVTEDGKLMVMHEYKATTKEWIWTFPGGMIEDGETPAEAAKRECEEELGIRVKKVKKICVVKTNFPKTSVTYFLGFGLSKTESKGWEKIGAIKTVTVDQLYKLALNGRIQDPRTVVAILALYRKRKQLV